MDADLFTEGAIYWYENKTNSKKDYDNSEINHDFLVSRPVYILRNNKTNFDEFTVNVVIVTSSPRRVGIPTNIDGFKDGKILPYNIRSVHTEYLTRYMGHASKEIMDEVYNAVGYHLGYSDEKPKYLMEHERNEQIKKEYVNTLNHREFTVYDFVSKKCLFKSNYYAESTELFQLYKKYYSEEGYIRLQDFNRAFSKILEVFSGVSIREEHQVKIIYGMSINGNVHKSETPEITSDNIHHKKKLYSEDVLLNFEDMTRDQIIDTLDDCSKKEYFSLDIVQKIDNYCRKINNMKFSFVSDKDIPAIKFLIQTEINEKKDKVFKVLDKGLNPLNMTTINQYIIFISTNEELLNHIDDKYLRKGGLPKLRKKLKNNVQHYFVKYKDK